MESNRRKVYYTMGEVSEMFDVKPSLIRFWEQKFEILKPDKNRKGNRLFTPQDVENLKLIYHLVKENGMTLAGAAKRLRDNREGEGRNMEVIEKLQRMRALLLEIRQELKSGGEELFLDTLPAEEPLPEVVRESVLETAKESPEGPAVPRFLQREIPIPPQPDPDPIAPLPTEQEHADEEEEPVAHQGIVEQYLF
ncbi:MAG: MerR family transcriptional regulator [Alistipes sp.]|nr:MerR family transcriptional regulator [Alistipes sp.]